MRPLLQEDLIQPIDNVDLNRLSAENLGYTLTADCPIEKKLENSSISILTSEIVQADVKTEPENENLLLLSVCQTNGVCFKSISRDLKQKQIRYLYG